MIKILKYVLLLSLLLPVQGSAQYYFFGRNKVQYEKFNWKVFKTKHFNIYYYDDMEEVARIGAAYAEEAYSQFKMAFNHTISHKVPLIFYNTSNQFEQTNTTPGFIPEGVGGFFEFVKGRVVLPYTGSLHDFRHVIFHELTHVFMATKLFRILKDHREPLDRYPPLWYTEGLAEFMSTKVDAQARMVMRDAVINGYFFNLENIYKISGTFLMYKEGQNFLEYVAHEYGREKVMQLLDNFWMYKKFNEIIKYTLGKSIKDIDKDWSFYLKRKYFPLVKKDAPPGNASKQLTDFGFNFSPVHYKVNGKEYIYFVGNRDGYASMYRLQLGVPEAEPELVLRGEKTEEFESFHLFQSSIDISKNGIISFVTKSGGTDAVHFFSIAENKIVKDFKSDNLISISSPKFSPGGNSAVFQGIDKKGFSDIYLLDIGTGKLTRLTNDYYDDRDPAFGLTPDEILFTSDRTAGEYNKKYNIFSYDLLTHRITYVTYLDANCYSPILSPDKKHLVFTSDEDGVRNIWSLDVRDGLYTRTVRRISNFITSAFNPSYIDSNDIAFTGFENFSFNIYRMKIAAENDSSSEIAMSLDSAAGTWRSARLAEKSVKEGLKYQKQYSLDYAQSQISTDPIWGTRGGAVLSLSDLLGNDNYYFLIYNTAQVQSDILKSFNVEIQKVELGQRANYGYGVFHFSGNRYDIRESNEFFFERSFGGFFVLYFPLSKFARIEADVSVVNSDKELVPGVLERKALLVGNTISYVFDNSLWGPTGPLDGSRARVLLGYTGDVKYSNVNYYSVIADYRHYFRLGYSSALAFRSAVFYNQGKEARRYFMGGSWDLRGWPRWSIRGEKMWLSSLELRFPLIDQINIKLPFMNLGFWGIRGALYMDAGSAWDTKYRSTLGDVGFGFRMNLFGAIVLRYDIGKKIMDDFNTFQKGLFYQFFFGWDF